MVTLDAEVYPHIFDAVVSSASYPALLNLRATCSALRTRVDKILLEHILVFRNGRTTSRLAPRGRLPCDHWSDDVALVKVVGIIDIDAVSIDVLGELVSTRALADSRKTSWSSNIDKDGRLNGIVIPVVRSFSHRRLEVVPVTGLRPRYGVDFYRVARRSDTRAVHLALERSDPMADPDGRMVWSVDILRSTWSRRIVIPRRTPLASSRQVESASLAVESNLDQALAYFICYTSEKEIWLVDREGELVQDVDGVQITVMVADRTRDQLLRAVKRALDSKGRGDLAPFVDKIVRFLSEDEYRKLVGPEAMTLEDDDHNFKFPLTDAQR